MKLVDSRSLKRLALLPIAIIIVLVIFFDVLNVESSISPLLLPILNTLFLGVIFLTGAIICARGFLSNGSRQTMLTGSGMLSIGLTAPVAGWLAPVAGQNVNITIFNLGILMASSFFLSAGIIVARGASSRWKSGWRPVLTSFYGVVTILLALVTWLSLLGHLPAFFVPAVGPTITRQIVLGTATGLMACSAILFLAAYSRSRINFLYWCSLGLGILTISLVPILLYSAFHNQLNWLGRFGQYLSSLYFLAAAMIALREARSKKIGVTELIDKFLSHSKANYELLVETATDAIVSVDGLGIILTWNKAAEKIFGHSSTDAIGSLFLDLIISSEYGNFLKGKMEASDKESSGQTHSDPIEVKARRRSGEEFSVELSIAARRLRAEQSIAIIVMRDITERKNAEEQIKELNQNLCRRADELKVANENLEERVRARTAELTAEIAQHEQAEEALRKSEERYRNLFDNSSDLIQSVLPDGRILYVNKAWQKVLGYSEEEIANLKVWDFIHPDSMNHCMETFQKVMSGENVSDIEAIFVSKNGNLVAVEGNAHARFIDGRPISTQGIFRDITTRKRAEERIINLNSVLLAIRGVNQLITHEKDKKRLIQQSCSLMVKTRGFLCAWILLFDEQRKYLSAAVTGGRETHAFYKQLEQGKYPLCVDRILAHKDFFAVCGDIVQSKLRCLPRDYYSEGSGIISRLEYEGKVYGILSAYIKSDYSFDPEEQSLFRELAGDIAFALYNIEREEKRKQGEEALRESEERFRTIINGASDGILLADLETKRFNIANRAICQMLGYSLEEIRNLRVTDIHPKKNLPYVMEQFEKQSRGEITLSGDIPIKRKDGSVFYADVSTSILTFSGRTYLAGIFRDTTERIQLMQSLTESEEKFRGIVYNISLGVFRTTPGRNGKFLEVNPAIEKISGYSRKELLNMKVSDLYANPEEREGILREVESIPASTQHEIRFRRKDGAEIIVSDVKVTVKDMHGKILYFDGILEDITERKKMEERLILTDRLASVGELASGIAHELNNPLTGVIGLSQLLAQRAVPEDIKEDLNLVYSEAQRAANVVKNLLTFARKHSPTKQLLNMNDVIGKVLELRAYEERVSNIEVITHLASDLPQIMADYFQLQQVFLNLVINAEYFMTEVHGKGTLTITSQKIGDVVQASFADDGPGVSEENIGRVFDPFFTTKEVGKGTGLGLSICHGIVSAHGGRIYAESKLGGGATFIVELPLRREEK